MNGLALLLIAVAQPIDNSPTTLIDLPAYRAALAPGAGGPAQPATFRDLWEHPDTFRGRRVRVEGRVGTRFRQEARGDFPALVELWIVSPAGDPTCLIFPETTPPFEPARETAVRFSGVFLKLLRYHGGDADRLAPLIVGDSAPTAIPVAAEEAVWGSPRVRMLMAAGTAGAVAIVLITRHLAAPRRRRLDIGPEPRWYGPDEFPPEGGA